MAFFEGSAIGKLWQSMCDAVNPKINPEGFLNTLRVDAAHLSGRHALEHFTAQKDKVRESLALLTETNPQAAFDHIFGMGNAIQSVHAIFTRISTFPLFMKDDLKDSFWEAYGTEMLEAFEETKDCDMPRATSARNYLRILSLMPDEEKIDFLINEKQTLGPLLSQKGALNTLPPFFPLYFMLPKDAEKAPLLDEYAPYLETYFAVPADEKDEGTAFLDSTFVGVAHKIYKGEGAYDVPPYLEEARRNIVLTSTTRLFNAAAKGGAMREEMKTALSHINVAGLADEDPVIWADKADARLYSFDTSTPHDQGEQLLVLCQRNAKALTPLFASPSAVELKLAFETALVDLTLPVALSLDDLEGMEAELETRRAQAAGQWPGYPAATR